MLRCQVGQRANLEASCAANNMFNPESKIVVNCPAIYHVIFASPQVAGVGQTQEEAGRLDLHYAAATYVHSALPER